MKKYSTLLLSLLLTSCNVDSSSLKIISPTGAPALAFYNHSLNSNYETNSTPSNIVSMMNSSSDYDVVVIDTVSGIKAIEKGAPYKIAATITFGNFYIASTGNDDNNTFEKEDTIVIFGQNQTPDLLFKYIYGEGYNIEYVTNVQDAAKCLAAGKNMITGSTVDYVFIAQPALYTILNNKDAKTYGKASIHINIQDEYFRKSGNNVVQASIFVNSNSDRNQLKSLLKGLENDIYNVLENPKLIQSNLNTEDKAINDKYGVNFNACMSLLNDNNAIGLGYKKAIENKDNIDKFIGLFNIGETNEEIYFK